MFLLAFLVFLAETKDLQQQEPLFPVLLESSTNPLERSEDIIPDSIDDSGDDYSSGDTYFILVTTFIEGESGSGKLWVVPNDQEMIEFSYELITGLDRPTGSCLDVNHGFLYIVDNGFEDQGYIYQYEVQWDTDEIFILSRNIYVIIYSGRKPYDCKIDQYGNMYFLEAEYDSINIISYLDLYSGFTNMNYTIYSSEPYVSYPVALQVEDSEDIYYANLYNGDEVGSINRADAYTEYINGGEVNMLVKNKYKTWGVAHTANDLVFFSLDSGEIWAVDDDNSDELYMKNKDLMKKPRGMCYGDSNVFVADYEDGIIWIFKDNGKQENPEMFIAIQGSYSVFCVNSAIALVVGWMMYCF